MSDLVSSLLSHGARVNDQIPNTVRQFTGQNRRGARTITPFPPGATPFFVAAWAQNVPLMNALLAAGADPQRTSFDGTTPLMAAAGLVGHPAGWSRPKYADPQQGVAAVKLTVEHGGNIKTRNALGQTALHGAARSGMNEIVQFLVDGGASLDAEDNNGDTPETLAERAEAKKTVELMTRLRAQASPSTSPR
jgi:ankyrin repeat protein